MAGQGRSDFYVALTMSLCALELKNIDKFAISIYIALKLAIQALGSYLKLVCQYKLHILPNTKVGVAKDHGKNYMKVRLPIVLLLLVIFWRF